MDCLELLAINGITGHDPCRALSASARNSLEPQTDLPVGAVLILTSKCSLKKPGFLPGFLVKSPGDGFEPPLKEPESFVLPLDDPGLNLFYKKIITPQKSFTREFAEKLKFFLQTLGNGFKSDHVLSHT